MEINLWIDDERPAPEQWQATDFDWAQTSQEAIFYLTYMRDKGLPLAVISFDHDLGYNYEDGSSLLDGGVQDDNTKRVLDWMIENNYWPTKALLVHSMNPIGSKYLLDTAKRYGPSDIIIARGPSL